MTTKHCFVPNCGNNSENCDKVFVFVPGEYERRKTWWQIVGHETPLHLKARLYCCEEHFNIPDDFFNWQVGRQPGHRLILKEDVLPRVLPKINLDGGLKRECEDEEEIQRKSIKTEPRASIEEEELIIKEEEVADELAMRPPAPSTSRQGGSYCFEEHFNIPEDSHNCQVGKQPGQMLEEVLPKINLDEGLERECEDEEEIQKKSIKTEPPISIDEEELIIKEEEVDELTMRQPTPLTSRRERKNSVSPINISSSSESKISDSLSLPSGNTSTFEDIETLNRLESTISNIERIPSFYIGLSRETYCLVKIICTKTDILYRDALITFKKIRLNDPLIRLHVDFDLSTSELQRIIQTNIPKVSNFMKDFIKWPTHENIRRALPIAFRARYAKVQSIIDCFEVEIKKPPDSVMQASTANYKQANTVKFLISCTPNGYINFISLPYPGRTSDSSIVESSGYCNKLPEGAQVLVDRGFENIQELLYEKNCTLIKPTSVSKNNQLSAEEVQENKRIASLRMKIEIIIQRVRKFSMLEPRAGIHHSLVPMMGDAAVIACGITNFQRLILHPVSKIQEFQ